MHGEVRDGGRSKRGFHDRVAPRMYLYTHIQVAHVLTGDVPCIMYNTSRYWFPQ